MMSNVSIPRFLVNCLFFTVISMAFNETIDTNLMIPQWDIFIYDRETIFHDKR